MKRLLLSLLFTLIALAANARVEDKIIWIADEDKFVETPPKTIIYEIPGKPTWYAWRVAYVSEIRSTINYDDCKTKSLKKPQNLQVRGYANRVRQLEYDTYVVEYKGRLYFLPYTSVIDNSILDSINTSLSDQYTQLSRELADVRSELDSLVTRYTEECESQYAHYSRLKESLPATIDSVKNRAKADYQALQKSTLDQWYNTLPKSTQNAYAKISVTEAQLSRPNSASGCDYTFTYVNNSQKTIKYLYWEGAFYNAVNDLVFCDIRDYCRFRGKDTGPVEPGESGGGVWDCVIYNWSADYVLLSGVTIIYMDGTTTTIGAGDLKRLATMPSSWDFYEQHGSEYEAVANASKEYERELRECDGAIREWERRLSYLRENKYSYPLSYHNSPFTYQDKEYQDVFLRISELYNRSNTLEKQLSKFKKANMLQE